MSDHDSHVRQIDAKVTALSDALAHLGRGTSLRELLKIIRFPGYTTPAELAFTIAMLEGMEAQVRTLAKMENDLLAASKLVVQGCRPGVRRWSKRKRQESNLPRTPTRPPTGLKPARPTGSGTLPG
jgi:hypothetical protein